MRALLALLIACMPAGSWGQTEADTSALRDTSAVADTSAMIDTSTVIESVPSSVPGASAFGSLQISADAESVQVIADGRLRGFAPVLVDSLAPGPHVVRLIPPDPTSWLTAVMTETVMVGAGAATERRFSMHQWYSISSIPAGEPVSTDDSLAGITPLLVPSARLTRETRIVIGGEAFIPARATLDDFVRGTLLVRLEPTSPGDMPRLLQSRELLPEPPSSTGLIVSGVASIAFGVAAAYFKGGADRAADQYLVTRDPSLLQKRDKMDKSAALAVVGLQVTLGLFMYFLLSR